MRSECSRNRFDGNHPDTLTPTWERLTTSAADLARPPRHSRKQPSSNARTPATGATSGPRKSERVKSVHYACELARKARPPSRGADIHSPGTRVGASECGKRL